MQVLDFVFVEQRPEDILTRNLTNVAKLQLHARKERYRDGDPQVVDNDWMHLRAACSQCSLVSNTSTSVPNVEGSIFTCELSM